ncbi:MAG: hypothetical protein HY820_31375 [Acidobacteria bacterium]|nr:hypothetical protein [Acidobacteriota bacterium]
MQRILERLVAANIELMPLRDFERHWVFTRDGFVALVERTAGDGFGKIGAPGLLTESGMAVLIQRNGEHHFVAKCLDLPATEAQIESMRSFATDLAAALQQT